MGSGQKEDPIATARSLIVEKRYNDALIVLAEVIRTDPERIDEAESLIRKIRNIRGDYNEKYEELIKVLYDERDVEKALAIIRELESLDKDPNAAAQNAVAKAKDSALFVYNQNRFNDIMTRAQAELARKNYWGAVEIYLSGFDLGREGFDKASYGNIIEGKVKSSLADLEIVSRKFVQDRNALIGTSDAALAALAKNDPAARDAAVTAFVRAYAAAASAFKTAVTTAKTLEEQNQRIVMVREGVKEDFFLGYTMRMAVGRKSSTSPEGIKGAVELFLKDRAAAVSAAYGERSLALFAEAKGRFSGDDLAGSRPLFEEAEKMAGLALRLADPWFAAVPTKGKSVIPEAWAVVEKEFSKYLGARTVLKGARAYVGLGERMASAKLAADGGKDDPRSLVTARNGIIAVGDDVRQIERGWREFGDAVRRNEEYSEESRNIVRALDEELRKRQSELETREISLVDRLAALEIAPLNDGLASCLDDYRKAEGLLNGVSKALDAASDTKILLKYPAESIEEITRLNAKFDDLERATRAFDETYRKEKDYVRASPGIQDKTRNARENLARIGSLRPSMAKIVEQARENVLLSERYKNEGNRKVAEAEAATRRNNFDAAREALAAARQRFSLSLSYQENADFRKESDARLLALAAGITDAENRLVIAEVRQSINEGKRLYYLNIFDQAEEVLLRAQTRWRTTQAEDNQEVSYWLGFVRAALFVKSSREILETDPLYVEMSQLLNLAREDFLKGKDLLEKGNRRDAIESFNKAQDKLQKVSLTFPFNQEASVLTLRIAQLKDRDNFSVLFRNKFRDARSKMQTNPQEGYIDLKDLEEIDPNFPGLKDAIYQAELALGIRVPPPDPKALAASAELYRQAFRIVAGNVRAQFPIALEQLNKAIELNPNNQQAIELKDRIQTDAGGQTSVVLSSVAEEQYRLAEKRFIEGSFFEALAIVQRLLQNKESKSYPPLLELKRRIESRI